MHSRSFDLHLPDDSWEDLRGDGTLLKSILWLNGCPLHLEAVAVDIADDGFLSARREEDEDRLDALERLHASRWQTLEIDTPRSGDNSNRYVVYAVPFGA